MRPAGQLRRQPATRRLAALLEPAWSLADGKTEVPGCLPRPRRVQRGPDARGQALESALSGFLGPL